ncbi:MAG: serine/threonine-protein kinase PknD [Mycobacterium sp.]
MGEEATFIAGYRVVERLGTGGMGEVFLVEHPRLPRRDALKLLDGGVSRNDEFRRRFTREANLLAPLIHPNIITLYDRGEFEGRLWLTMEYVAGTDLAKLLKSGPLAPELAMQVVAGVGAALDFAYTEHRITHRDVKPANILVKFAHDQRLRAVKLADFGIAKAAGEATSLTSAGTTVGTVSYMSPEAIEGRDLNHQADIYSLGCTAFEMLTGSLPFTANSITALMAAHLNRSVPTVTERNPALPAYFDGVMARALAKDPGQRYQTCAEFLAALGGADAPVTAVPTTASDRSESLPRPHTYIPGAATMRAEAQTSAPTVRTSSQPPLQPVPRTLQGDKAPTARPRWWRRKWLLVLTGVVLLGVIGAVTHNGQAPPSQQSQQATSASEQPQQEAPSSPQSWQASNQTVLPFTGLNNPDGVAVDSTGNVYVTDALNNRVVKLVAGSSTQQVLPFAGLHDPGGVAVDSTGNIYVADGDSNSNYRVVKLVAGSSTQQALPFAGLNGPQGVAVDSSGNIYVADADWVNSQVVELVAGSSTQQMLPFTGLNGTSGVAVDSAGNVYVADGLNKRVVELVARSSTQQVLPFTGLNFTNGVAVDSAGNVYVADAGNNRVVRLARG